MTAAQKKQELIRLFGSYSKRLERLYDQYATDLVGLGLHESLLEEDPLFYFDDFPQHRESLNNIFSDFVRKQLLTIKAAIADGVTLAFLHDKGDLQGASVLGNAAITHARETAADAFYRGRMKPQQGLSLSQLVWNYSQQTKSEFEMAMSTVIAEGLQQGTSAEELGRKVRHLLNNPDMMHRRYHEKVLRNGERVDVVTWRRRVIGEDGKVHFVKGPLEKVGRGHYRSARMNAYRLMRSEINMAYHRANHERWMQEPFVIGIHIWPSDQHPMEDVCDELKGDYPKDFLFLGWHPACMDTCTPITPKGDERREYLKRIAKGEDVSGYVSPNRVRDVPDGYKRYIAENADRIVSADRRDKLAYHLRDNRKYWEAQFTVEQLAAINRPQLTIHKIKRLAREWFQGTLVYRDELPSMIKVSRGSIDEWLNQPHKHYNEKNQIVLRLGTTLSEAKYIGKGEDKPDKTATRFVHLFEIKIKGDSSYIIVKEYNDGNVLLHGISDSPNIIGLVIKK